MKLLFALFFLIPTLIYSQESDTIPTKHITINRVEQAPKIDGVLDDPAWQNAAIATDFVERMPVNGQPIPDSLSTEVKIIYDDLGVYFGATLKDPEPSRIMTELSERDNIGASDFFFILLNGYNDRQQSMQFIVTSAGVQYDAKMTNSNEDASWNAVWYSEARITEEGWIAEVFIPYSELRFPEKNIQEWGLQMERDFRRTGTRYSWSHVNNKKGSFSLYDGEIHGIKNIKTQARLSFQPYISSYLTNYAGDTEVNFNGGLDLKYGINDAFTLDMILIPDFGQTKFDEEVLNLSAFEVQYEENRAFFTEGTELFTKGNLFYSRRVGGPPSGRPELLEDEELEEFPSTVDLINAVKVSGRTAGGLGIGFFNAVTEKTYAKIRNQESGEIRKTLVEPLTNYNILVLDQRFGDNSSVSFINTNTTREGHFRDANASGLYMDLTNKSNTLRYSAGAEGSWVHREDTKFGAELNAVISKINGKNRFQTGVELRTKDYNINDLGYSSSTNYVSYFAGYNRRLLQPKGFLNNMFLNFNLQHMRRLETDLFSRFVFNFNSSFTTKDFLNFGGGFETTPFGTQDIYEARVEGRHFDIPTYYDVWVWLGTDFRKKFSLQGVVDWYKYDERGRGDLIVEFGPRYRFSDKFTVNWLTNIKLSDKEEGFVNLLQDEILFGQRDRNTITSSLGSTYIFNNKTALNLAFRHYYSEVFYSKYSTLKDNGELQFYAPGSDEYDTTYNSWNLDLRFSWWFAPGSQLTLLYRNAITGFQNQSHINFRDNFEFLFEQQQLNSLSLKVSYYLDYNRMKTWFSPKQKAPAGADAFGGSYRTRKNNPLKNGIF